MLIDLHAHSSAISPCCRIDAPEVLRRAQAAGLDGIVLTNHYQKSYIQNGDVQGFVQRYLDEYACAEQSGRALGCKVFFGIEVTMELYPAVHMLIYGVDGAFLRAHPLLFDHTQEELYRLVHEYGGTLIQAHPFRNGAHVLDPAFLDGVEINCHPLYKLSYSAELTDIARQNGLALTCGGDYHADTYRPLCGTRLPDDIDSDAALAHYLRTADTFRLRIHEPNAEGYTETELQRGFL